LFETQGIDEVEQEQQQIQQSLLVVDEEGNWQQLLAPF